MTIPADFDRRIESGNKPQILIEADATDPAVASGAISTLGTVAQRALLREQGTQAEAAELANTQLDVVVHRALQSRKASRNTTSCPVCSA